MLIPVALWGALFTYKEIHIDVQIQVYAYVHALVGSENPQIAHIQKEICHVHQTMIICKQIMNL
jgi:hypothetical protein